MEWSKEKAGKKLNTANHEPPDIVNLSKVSERHYQDLFNNASDAIFICDLKGNITKVNEAAVTLTGYPRNELTGMNVSEFLTAKSFKATMKKQKALLEDETATQRYELEIIRKDGVRLSAESRTSLLTHNGWPPGIQCIVRDITKRKRVEEALRNRTHDLAERVKELNCLYAISNLVEKQDISLKEIFQGTVDLIPPAWQYPEVTCARITLEGQRFQTDNFKETTWKQTSDIVVHGDRIGTLEVCYLEERPEIDAGPFLEGERLLIGAVAERLGKITERKWVEEEISKYRDHLEKIVIEQTAEIEEKNKKLREDIAEQKRIEETLRFLSSVVEQAKDSVIVTNRNYEIEYVNKATEELYGYSREELVGLTPLILNAEPMAEDIQRDIYQTVSSGGVMTRAVLNKRKDGSTFVCDFKVSPLSDKDGRVLGYIGIQRDITEQKRIEEILQASEERFRNIYEEAPIGIELYDCDGRLLTVNRACLGIFGVSNVAEVRGFKLFEDPNITDEVKQRLHNGKTVRYEAPFDFEKVKEHKLYDTGRSGTIYLNVLITPLGVRREKPLDGYLVQVQDITERKRVEAALQESEQNFRNSLDSSPLGIRIVTAEGELLYANQAILDIYGYSSVEELKSVPTEQRYTPKSYAKHRERAKKRKLGKPVPSNYEVSIVRKDGEVRHLAVFRKEVIWGGEIQFQALYQDITERKLTAEELRIFKAISDRAGYGIGIITPEGDLTYVSESFAKMHGYTIEELIGKHFSILHTKEQMRVVERLRKKLIQAGSYFAEEVWHKKKNGTVFPTLMTVTAIKNDMGKPLYLSATVIDITERKRVEMALRQSEEFNSSLLTNSPNPILVLNADASIRYVNPALEKLTGFSPAELIGSKPPYPWWIEETPGELSRRLVQAMQRGTGKYESLYKKKNGERFWVGKILKTVKANGEFKYYLVNWVDLTEQKRLKANMEFYLSQVTRAQEAERKRIAREIHDESIQSLATLALNIDAIAREKERLPEDVIQHLKRLRAETNSILDGLRRFSHELRPGVIDQVGLVPALEILTEELNKEKGVKASLEIGGSERRLMPETEVALFRIAQEALHNVRKHSRATQAAIRLKFIQGRVKLTVSDNGRGFEPPDTLSDFAAESKLGLIGIQERTRLLGGKLLVKSWAGRGTTVVVEVANIG